MYTCHLFYPIVDKATIYGRSPGLCINVKTTFPEYFQWHISLYSALTVAGTALAYNSSELPNSHFKLEENFKAP
jgi:hypothetical protein